MRHHSLTQALKGLREQAYRFTTCPEESAANRCGDRQGTGYVDLVCSLCIPIGTRQQLSPAGDGHIPPCSPDNEVIPRDTVKDGVASPPRTKDVAVNGAVNNCGIWRVLPARIAMSLRLERLAPSRPSRPSRVPSVAPATSVCRLRLRILSGGLSARTSHPEMLQPRRSLLQLDDPTVVVGWNGYDDSVGPRSEWQVKIPPTGYVDDASSSSFFNDVLLTVPQDGRDRLVLTLSFVTLQPQIARSASKEIKAETVTLGTVSIDWDGLSSIPCCTTNYFVDTRDGRSSSTRGLLPRPMPIDLELVAPLSTLPSTKTLPPAHGVGVTSPSSSSSTAVLSSSVTASDSPNCVVDGSVETVKAANANSAYVVVDKELRQSIQTGCCRTAGFSVRVTLQLEQSPAFVPHVLSLSPAAARSPAASSPSMSRASAVTTRKISASVFSLGDFRDPCRRVRVPFLRFLWPWDDYWLALTERRSSLVSGRPWRLGSRRAVSWPNPKTVKSKHCKTTGLVSIRLPLLLSGLDGSAAWPGSEQLRIGDANCALIEPTAGALCDRRELTGWAPQHPTVLIEAYDMGPYAPLEHQAARRIQRLCRRALDALQNARLWWEWEAEVQRWNAAVCVQAHYRGWKCCQWAQDIKREAERRNVAAAVIQRRCR